uniref:Uncharacterized protein n=1 Tax=Anguilla anguilla TaxID=7936 RepID=A0A0E9R1Y1_ANGAN
MEDSLSADHVQLVPVPRGLQRLCGIPQM